MMVYSSDVVEQKLLKSKHPHLFDGVNPPAPPAPPAPPIPRTEQGEPVDIESVKPASLLESLKLGKKLKSVKTVVKDKTPKGTEINAEASSSNVNLEDIRAGTNSTGNRSLLDALSDKFNKIQAIIVDEETNVSDD
jgi:hypothetical protein